MFFPPTYLPTLGSFGQKLTSWAWNIFGNLLRDDGQESLDWFEAHIWWCAGHCFHPGQRGSKWLTKQGQLYPLCFINMAPGLVRSVSRQLLRNHNLPMTLAFPLPRKAGVSGASLSYRPVYSIGPPSLYENPWTPELHGVRASLQKVLLRIQSEQFKSCYLIFSQYYIHFPKDCPAPLLPHLPAFWLASTRQYQTVPCMLSI